MAINRRSGFTLIELLVTITVIGILVALLLPAVQLAREAARRSQCASNLMNIGLAIHHHEEIHNRFPSGVGQRPPGGSCLVQLLPLLEQRALFDSINMKQEPISGENSTATLLAPSIYLCPTDPWRRTRDTERAVNYGGNAGRSAIQGEGVFIGRPVSARDISDGLSQTAGVAEWIAGPGSGQQGDRRTFKYPLQQVYSGSPADFDAFVQACRAVDSSTTNPNAVTGSKGQFWLDGALAWSLYNHVLPPNQPSCSAKQDMDATTVGSYHPGGVHALTMDGSVHFVKDSINPRIWSALGSRSGGEGVGEDPF
jgi:prepilin-type N-terminal cleavage/methylation domain-containing protein